MFPRHLKKIQSFSHSQKVRMQKQSERHSYEFDVEDIFGEGFLSGVEDDSDEGPISADDRQAEGHAT
ncbi:hypothetical protein ACOSP7_027182 [Xanthoceras sorbifolium]